MLFLELLSLANNSCADTNNENISSLDIGINDKDEAVFTYSGRGKFEHLEMGSQKYQVNTSQFIFAAYKDVENPYVVGNGSFSFTEDEDVIKINLKLFNKLKINFLYYDMQLFSGFFSEKINPTTSMDFLDRARLINFNKQNFKNTPLNKGQYKLLINGKFTKEYVTE